MKWSFRENFSWLQLCCSLNFSPAFTNCDANSLEGLCVKTTANCLPKLKEEEEFLGLCGKLELHFLDANKMISV